MKSAGTNSSENHSDLFDTTRSFMLYLLQEKMVKIAIISRVKMAHQVSLIARRRAIFFCTVALAFLIFGVMFSISCSHTPSNSTVNSTEVESTVDMETIVVQSEQVHSENDSLKEENDRLRAEIVRLNLELAAAHEAIYTLNRKLDAIFNPDVKGE